MVSDRQARRGTCLIQYAGLYLPSFVLGTQSTFIIIGYFMNRTGGSVLPAIMIHGICNDAVGIAGEATMVVALTPYHQLTQNIPFAIFAALLVVIHGKDLGRKLNLSTDENRPSQAPDGCAT